MAQEYGRHVSILRSEGRTSASSALAPSHTDHCIPPKLARQAESETAAGFFLVPFLCREALPLSKEPVPATSLKASGRDHLPDFLPRHRPTSRRLPSATLFEIWTLAERGRRQVPQQLAGVVGQRLLQ